MKPAAPYTNFSEVYLDRAPSNQAGQPFLLGVNELDYEAMFEFTEQLRATFDALGVSSGDRLALVTADDTAFIAITLAALANGIVVVPLDPDLAPNELSLLLEASDAALLIGDAEFCKAAEAAPARRLSLDETEDTESLESVLADTPSDILPSPHDLEADSLALINFTSGTTSQPKGVMISHANLVAQLEECIQTYHLSSEGHLFNGIGLQHADGLIHGPLLAFYAGAALIRGESMGLHSVFNDLELVKQHGASHMVTTPSALALIRWRKEAAAEIMDGHRLQVVISAAAPLEEQLWRESEDVFHAPIANVYGLTETTLQFLCAGPDDATRRYGTVGKPIFCSIRIVDDSDNELGVGEVGELLVAGPQVFQGYWNNAAATREAFTGRWLRTGDLASFDEEGFVRIVGRKKNIIKVGGLSVFPDDIAAILHSLDNVLDACVLGIPDEIRGEKIVACVVPKDPEQANSRSILDACADQLTSYKVPGQIEFFDSLPRGISGKVKLPELRAQLQARA